MIGSIEAPVERTTVADSANAESWRANAVDGNRVRSRLTQQWLRLKGPRPRRLRGAALTSGAADDGGVGPGVYARTNTTNLIVVARSATRAERAERAINGLRTHYPTRAIMVVADPALDRLPIGNGPDDGALTIRTRLVRPDSDSPIVSHFESVTVTGGPRRLGNPLRTALPLCIPDLPIVLWWAGDMQDDFGMFRDVAEVSDRVIVDSADLGDVPRGLATLAPLVAPSHRSAATVTDMAWLRLRDWRNLIAQFYDAPPHPGTLSSIASVTVDYRADPGPDRVSGMSSAILLVGWLASRLGWRLSDRVARTSSGLRLVFTSSGSLPVIVRLQATTDAGATMGLAGVTVRSTGVAEAEYRVEQFSDIQLLTTSILPNHPPMTRHVMVSPSDDSALIENVLPGPGRDLVFDDALATVATAFARR